jgi:hypothetical protein
MTGQWSGQNAYTFHNHFMIKLAVLEYHWLQIMLTDIIIFLKFAIL